MNDQLLSLIIKQKLTFAAICAIVAILLIVFLLWIYAEFTFYQQKKLERIEAVRDIMDGIELSMRARRNSRQHKVIKMTNLDKAKSHRNTKYSKIIIDRKKVAVESV